MQHEEIRFPNGRSAFISPLPRSRMAALEAMLTSLQRRWQEEHSQCTALMLEDDAAWEQIQAIASLFPRLDRPGEFGVDLTDLRCDERAIESLFLYQRDGEEYKPGRLVELHYYEPVERPGRMSEEPEAIESSGDPDADLLAILANAFNAQDALAIWDRLPSGQLNKFLYYLGELRRDPDERKMENLAEDYEAWKSENMDTLKKELGFGPAFSS